MSSEYQWETRWTNRWVVGRAVFVRKRCNQRSLSILTISSIKTVRNSGRLLLHHLSHLTRESSPHKVKSRLSGWEHVSLNRPFLDLCRKLDVIHGGAYRSPAELVSLPGQRFLAFHSNGIHALKLIVTAESSAWGPGGRGCRLTGWPYG